MNINGICAIVTGGASGLGGATAALLAQRGAQVTIIDLQAEIGEAHAAKIGARFEQGNVTDEAGIAAIFDKVEAADGVARILVNCAGIAPAIKTVGREFKPHPLDAFRKAVEINLVGTFNLIVNFSTRVAQAEAVGEERGVIINTASIAAMDGQIGQAAYASSKAGIVGLTLPVARDLAQHKIRICTIAPGLFRTPLLAGLPQAVQDSLAGQVPHPQRLGEPEDYAALVEAIITNPMLNGETIRLDGAIRMPPK